MKLFSGSTANNNASRRPNPARQNQSSRQPTKVDMKKYERMISAAHVSFFKKFLNIHIMIFQTNFSDIPCGQKSIDCDICCKKNDVFGVGSLKIFRYMQI